MGTTMTHLATTATVLLFLAVGFGLLFWLLVPAPQIRVRRNLRVPIQHDEAIRRILAQRQE